MQRLRIASLVLPVAALLLPKVSHADPATPTAPGEAAPTPPKTPDEARYAYLKEHLDAIEGPTERWFTGWTWTYAWLAGGQTLLATTSPTSDLRAVSIVGAVESAGGLGIMLISPNTMKRDWARVRAMPGNTPLEIYLRRQRAEEVLRAVAFEEWFQHSIITHAGLFVATAAGGAILHYGAGVPLVPSIAAFVGSFALAEVQIWSRPFSAGNAWDGYIKGYHPGDPHLSPAQWTISLAVTPTGVAAHGTF